MELEPAAFDLLLSIDNALSLCGRAPPNTAPRLMYDERLGEFVGDEQNIKILLNLLSNAVKFTLEAGRI